jgi:hypothetical protein
LFINYARLYPARILRKPYTSPFRGVSWDNRDRKWRAEATINGRRFYLGSFTNEVSAARAYDRLIKEHHADFSRLNFPERA